MPAHAESLLPTNAMARPLTRVCEPPTLEPVATTPDRVTGATKKKQYHADDQQDNSNCPEDPYMQQEAHNQQDDT
jgi:hypothetical protein